MSQVKPFKIAIPDAKLEKLKQKLALTDFPDEIENAGWDYGAPLSYIKRLVDYWQQTFDWRRVESKLNELPQFSVPIEVEGFETLNIHFVHQPSASKNAIPLLFAHGWPGSFIEVTKLLPELALDGEDFPAFHVVAPSLPNFGFSEGTSKKGFNGEKHAEVCHKLMTLLGYNKYVTQGGDLGYSVTRFMALKYPQSCLANHLNMATPKEPTATSHPALHAQTLATPLTSAEKTGLARYAHFQKSGMGYFTLQATKPQTLGYSAADSPIGLLAWIYEKLHDWSDDYPWNPEEILTWVSMYYFSTAGPTASFRIYYESTHGDAPSFGRESEYISDAKIGIARFAGDIVLLPKLWARTLGPVVFESEWGKGGHFAAWERPDAVVNDLRKMFGVGGGAHEVVEGILDNKFSALLERVLPQVPATRTGLSHGARQ